MTRPSLNAERLTSETLASSADNPMKLDTKTFIRTQLIGAMIALVLGVCMNRLFRANGWHGQNAAQWITFYSVMWLTTLYSVPQARKLSALLVCSVGAALMIWLTTVAM